MRLDWQWLTGDRSSGRSQWRELRDIGGVAGNLIGKKMDRQAQELTQAVPTAEVNRVGEGINMTFDASLAFQAALDAASPHDSIVVRAGSYRPGRTDKGVRLSAEGVVLLDTGLVPFVVENLPRGQALVLDTSSAPTSPLLDRWLEIYRGVAYGNDAEPDAGRWLLGWAREAGFTDITPNVSTWLFADEVGRSWWGSTWAQRVLHSSLADQALEQGVATGDELEAISSAWQAWADEPDGWFVVPHGELLCTG